MILAHRIRLDPNKAQTTHLARAAGIARFAYNWALVECERQFEACKVNPALPRPNQAVLGRQLNAIKRIQFPWMLEVTKNAPQMAIRQLGRAFQNFFDKRARYPRFRRKGTRDRFTLHSRPLVCRYQYRHFRRTFATSQKPRRGRCRLRGNALGHLVDGRENRWTQTTTDIPEPTSTPVTRFVAQNKGFM